MNSKMGKCIGPVSGMVRNFSQTFANTVEMYISIILTTEQKSRTCILFILSSIEAVVSLFFIITHQPFWTCLWVYIGHTVLSWCATGLQGQKNLFGITLCDWEEVLFWPSYIYYLHSFLSLCLTWSGSVHSCSLWVCIHLFIYPPTVFKIPGYVLNILCTK